MATTTPPHSIEAFLTLMKKSRKIDNSFNRIFYRNKISKMTIYLMGAAVAGTAAQPFLKRVDGWKVIDDCVQNARTMYTPRYFKSKRLLRLLRLTLAIYCTGVSLVLLKRLGVLPFYTFSILNWNILALYLWCAALGRKYGGKPIERLAWFLKYPAIGNAILICVIFWTLLWFPSYVLSLRGDKLAGRVERFFRRDFLMLNVHVGNAIIAITDFMLDRYVIGDYDLWCNQAVILAYGLFYQTFLVSQELEFYFFLSLRSKFALPSHLAMMATIFGVYKFSKNVFGILKKGKGLCN